jgi:hypothetical protein
MCGKQGLQLCSFICFHLSGQYQAQLLSAQRSGKPFLLQVGFRRHGRYLSGFAGIIHGHKGINGLIGLGALAIVTNFDPNIAGLGIGNGQGFDYLNGPSSKRYGFSIKASF